MTALGPFSARLAGQLSGGMKQKLGLACTLVRSPELLLLDEPTVGVDPLSRRELWEIVRHLVTEQGLTVLLSTAYLDEAERCSRVIVLHRARCCRRARRRKCAALAAGRMFRGHPAAGADGARPAGAAARSSRTSSMPCPTAAACASCARPSARHGPGSQAAGRRARLDGSVAVPPRFEDGFMVLLRQRADARAHTADRDRTSARAPATHEPAVRVQRPRQALRRLHRGRPHQLRGAPRRDLRAARPERRRQDHDLSHAVRAARRRAAASCRSPAPTCAHAPASARAAARLRGAEVLALWPADVTENLEFFASAYGLRGERRRERIDWAHGAVRARRARAQPTSAQLPGGYKQRLAMAAALLHEPEILFLDEPTSGADPLARRDFWRRITALAEQGVTVIVTTHFMQEAEYCDRVAIMDAGQVLAQGSPAEIRGRARSTGPRRADHGGCLHRRRRGGAQRAERRRRRLRRAARAARHDPRGWRGYRRTGARSCGACARWCCKETRQIVRDPSSIAIGVVLPLILILLFGYGLSLDVKNVPVAVVIEEPVARGARAARRASSSRLTFTPQVAARACRRRSSCCSSTRSTASCVIPTDFARRLAAGDAQVQLIVHGSDANRARIIEGYVEGAVGSWAARQAAEGKARAGAPGRSTCSRGCGSTRPTTAATSWCPA